MTVRLILCILREETCVQFPLYDDKAVRTFFFMRYLCPAIVDPLQFGILSRLLHSLDCQSPARIPLTNWPRFR